MIQRIQTVYMILAIVAVVLGMCNPIGVFTIEDSLTATLYNLWVSFDNGDGTAQHVVMPWAALFALLTLVATLLTVNIFLFKKRALQMRIANFSMLLLVGYFIAGGVFLYLQMNGEVPCTGFRPTVWAAMPLIALIFSYLAFRGILKDQLLINSLNRIR